MNTNDPNSLSLNKPVDNDAYEQNLIELEDASNTSTESPNERGSHSELGSNASPESDDDVLQNAHQMGIAKNANLENPEPLNLAQDVADAEEYKKTH